jgi:DNA-binding MarR family transcriptional regulator
MQQSTTASQTPTVEDTLVRFVMAVGRRFRTRLDGDTVDPSQAALLHTLHCHGAMRLGDIADAVRLDASTVSRHIQQLGDRGLIERESDPEDGRARIIALTDAGRTSLRHTFDQRRAVIASALDEWSEDDRERFRHDLDRLTTSLEAPS